MISIYVAPELHAAMKHLQKIVLAAQSDEKPVLIFCEDKFTLMTERAVCDALGGTFSVTVSTLARYLRGERKIISKQGSVMAIRRILSERKGELQCFRTRGAATHNAESVYDMIAQLSSSCVSPEALEEADCGEDILLKRKLHDLSLLFTAYHAFLSENGYFDESESFRLLPEAIRKDDKIANSHVVFFGFPSFTRQMSLGVSACLERAFTTTGVFLGGTEELYQNESAHTFQALSEPFGGARCIALPSTLPQEAECIRTGIFLPESFKKKRLATDRVQLYVGRDTADEWTHTAAQILKRVRGGMRYRDMAVLTPNVEKKIVELKRIFSDYGIPYFVDLKKPLTEHPACAYLLACLDAAADGFSPESVQKVAANVLFGESDNYRNYLLKYAVYRGAAKKPIKQANLNDKKDPLAQYDAAELEGCRTRLLRDCDFSRCKNGEDYADRITELLSIWRIDWQTEKLMSRCSDSALSDYLQQANEKIPQLIEEARALTLGQKMTCKEFRDILCNGFAACEISMIPLLADAVFIGDCTAAKYLPVPVLFCIGLTNDVPTVSEDTALLSDREIGKLHAVKVEIEPGIRQVNLRARESLGLNLCSFTQELLVGYPLSADGGETTKSEVIGYLSALFELKERRIEDEWAEDRLALCVSQEVALRQMLKEKIRKQEGKENEFDSLYAALDEETSKQAYWLGAEPVTNLTDGEKLFFGERKSVSPTLLETYFACPYQNFVKLGLRLREREESTVQATDSGTFIHAVLEEVGKALREGSLADETACAKFAQARAEEKIEQPPFVFWKDTPAGQYSVKQICADAVAVARVLFRQIDGSAFRVAQTEKVVQTKIGNAFLYGKIDRVDETDEYVRIVDYKTGSIDSTPVNFYVGKKLQPELYLYAVSKELQKKPAAAFYFPANSDYSDVEKEKEKYTMEGFFNHDETVQAALDAREGEKTETFFRPNSKNGLSEGEFADFLYYSVLIGEVGAQEIKEGYIAPKPYEGACSYCAYRGMCGQNGDSLRKEREMSCTEIAEIARRKKNDE